MKNQLKIAVVAACPFPYSRGTPIRILRMVEGLVAHGHEVHVITYHLGQHIEDLPFPIHRIPNIPTYHKLSPGPTYQKVAILDTLLAIKLFQVLQGQNFDIIHAHHFEGLLVSLPVSKLLRIPIVFDVHTLLSSELPYYSMGLSSNLLHKIGNFLDHALPHRANHIVTVTNSIRNKLIDEIKIQADKVTTIYGGIEAEHFSHHTLPKLDSTSHTLIYTGNLAPYQGVDLMFRAFRRVLDHYPNTKLKLITNSPLDSYSDLIERFDIKNQLIIENTDYFHLPDQLYSADIALHPRVKCDGLPLKLLNYMAAGRPIVSFAGSAEVLEHQITGLVVEDYDIDAFASAIVQLFENQRLAQTLGKNAQLHVNEFFVWEEAIKSLEKIYSSLLEKKP